MLYLTILKFQLRFHSQLSLSPITRHSWDLMVVQPTIPVCLELPVFSPENLSPDSPSVLGKPEELHLLPGESQAKRTGFACLPLLPIHDLGAVEVCYTSGTTSLTPTIPFHSLYFGAERWGCKNTWLLLVTAAIFFCYLCLSTKKWLVTMTLWPWWIEASPLIGHRGEDTRSMGPIQHIILSDGNAYSRSVSSGLVTHPTPFSAHIPLDVHSTWERLKRCLKASFVSGYYLTWAILYHCYTISRSSGLLLLRSLSVSCLSLVIKTSPQKAERKQKSNPTT